MVWGHDRHQPGGLAALDPGAHEPADPGRRGAEAGASTQAVLLDYGRVTGLDVSFVALEYCRWRRGQSVACASVEAPPFPSRSFDLVTSFDVLYSRAVAEVEIALTESPAGPRSRRPCPVAPACL